jgi:hypothetical protein
MRGRIQVSQTTADLIRSAGQGSWVQPRKDTVVAKGLGALKTFWIEQETKQQAVNCSKSSNSSERVSEGDTPPSKQTEATERMDLEKSQHGRHVDWMTEVLSDYIKKIVSTVLGVYNIKNTKGTAAHTAHVFTGIRLQNGLLAVYFRNLVHQLLPSRTLALRARFVLMKLPRSFIYPSLTAREISWTRNPSSWIVTSFLS